MTDTTFFPNAEQKSRMFEGHDFAGSPLPDFPNTDLMVGASGLYSTPDDILTWLEWHLGTKRASDSSCSSRHDHSKQQQRANGVPFSEEVLRFNHATWLQRDNVHPAYALDESGHADAIGFGWLFMNPENDRPLIMQKAGGLQGVFCFCAFSPARGIGGFIAVNKFDLAAGESMAKTLIDTISQLSQR